MNQRNNFRAMWLDPLARFGQGDRIAPMQKQGNVFRSEFLGNGAPNPTARTRNKNSFAHVRRSVKRLFAVSHKRNRTSCCLRRLSIFGQSARTIFSPVEGTSRKSSV